MAVFTMFLDDSFMVQILISIGHSRSEVARELGYSTQNDRHIDSYIHPMASR